MIDLEKITEINRHPVSKNQELQVEWFVGKRCNYDCSYCHDRNHDNFSPHTDIKYTIDTIGKMIEKFDNRLKINFTGGEPTVHPDFEKLCEFMSDKDINVSMTTNGSRLAQYYINIYPSFKHITFSQHFEHAKNEVFLPKMKLINESRGERGMQVQVMYHAEHEDSVIESIEYYKANEIPYTIRRIRPTKNHKYPVQTAMAYSDEQLDTLRKHQTTNTGKHLEVTVDDTVYPLHANELNGLAPKERPYLNFHGWMCWAGVNFIRIHENLVYRCWGEIRKPIGDIRDPDFKLLDNPSPCIANKCACIPEISTRKTRPVS